MTVTIAVSDEEMRAFLADDPNNDVVMWVPGDPPLGRFIDLLVLPYKTTFDELSELDPAAVGMIQARALGYDGVAEAIPDGILYCNAVGVHEVPTAEIAVALVLAAQRGLTQFAQNQTTATWGRDVLPGLAGRRALIVGVGGVGSAIEARLRPFDVQITRSARSARDDASGHVHAESELRDLLPLADIVILAVPLSADTTHLADAAFLDAMKPGALLVNISRGAVVDTDALTERVLSGNLRAALDVTDPEPLPPRHPLWKAPGVTITPHVGGNVQSMASRMNPLILRQIAHLAAGEAPDHIVFGGIPHSGAADAHLQEEKSI